MKEFLLVLFTETSANNAGTLGQTEIVVEEYAPQPRRLDLPHRLAVLFGGGMMERSTGISSPIRPYAETPVLRRLQWHIARHGAQKITQVPQWYADQVCGHLPQPVVLPSASGVGGDPAVDGLDRPGVYGPPLHGRGPDVGTALDGAWGTCQYQAGSSSDADDGSDGDLPQTPDHDSGYGTHEIPLFATGVDAGSFGPGVMFGHHLYLPIPWFGRRSFHQHMFAEKCGVSTP